MPSPKAQWTVLTLLRAIFDFDGVALQRHRQRVAQSVSTGGPQSAASKFFGGAVCLRTVAEGNQRQRSVAQSVTAQKLCSSPEKLNKGAGDVPVRRPEHNSDEAEKGDAFVEPLREVRRACVTRYVREARVGGGLPLLVIDVAVVVWDV